MSGFFGCISKNYCTNDVFYGTDYNSHLGTKKAGMAVQNHKGIQYVIHSIENNYFRAKFESELPKLSGTSGIGIISDMQSQPLVFHSHLGKFAIATVGKISNKKELEERILKKQRHFTDTGGEEVNETELAALLIDEEETLTNGIKNFFNLMKGSCSILILTEKGIYAARDKLGRTPIILGKNDVGYALSSESMAFYNLGYETEHYLGPGEILHVTADGYEQMAKPGNKMQICSFLWVYYGFPASYYEKINVEDCRYKCGAALAKNDNTDADLISGIPDSGIGHAIGFANEKNIPYKRAFVKYTPTWPRSFMPQNQKMRDLVARMKLIPIKEIIDGKKVVFLDDSIVRGTQLKDNTRKLFEEGAREVHIKIACPPLLFPCEYLNFSTSRTRLELAGRTAIKDFKGTDNIDLKPYLNDQSEEYATMIEQIKKRLNITSLQFQKIDDLIDAIGLPKKQLCTHCWDNSSYS